MHWLLFGLFFGATASPAPTPVQTEGANITVTTCHAQLDPPPLRIAYVNTASRTAVEVDFVIESNAGLIHSVIDRGTFTPGKSVNHVFAFPSGTSPLGMSSARCIVSKVVYDDGTSWTNPEKD